MLDISWVIWRGEGRPLIFSRDITVENMVTFSRVYIFTCKQEVRTLEWLEIEPYFTLGKVAVLIEFIKFKRRIKF